MKSEKSKVQNGMPERSGLNSISLSELPMAELVNWQIF